MVGLFKMFGMAVLVLGMLTMAEAMEPKDMDITEDLFQLSLIHWNDFHARFEQTGWAGGSCPTNDNSSCVGGVARVATAIKDLKAQYPHSVFLNAGDVFQGTLWYTLFRWNATVRFMNMLPHDAMTLGNHEFDNGLEGIIPFMEQANFPIVVANIDDSEEPDFQGLYNKSIVIEREGRKIGIVGYLLNSTHTIASTENLRFLGEVETVTREVSVLKEQGADIIIALSHCGLQADREVAFVVPGLDIIVGGHSHTLLYNGTAPRNDTTGGTYPIVVHQDDGRQVLIVQAGANSKYLGHLLVHFDSLGEVVSWSGNPILMDQSIEPDPEIVAELEPFRLEVEQLGSMPIGRTRVRLSRPCSLGECSLGNMITDAMVEEYVALAPENAWTYAAIAMMNSGGIRAEISELNDGVILFNDLATAQPFQNTVDTLELEGHVLLQVIELSAARPFSSRSYLISDPEELTRDARVFSGYGFLQYSGIHVTYNISLPAGSRVQELSILCDECDIPEYQPLNLTKWYRIAMASFLAEGGDDFGIIPQNRRNHNMGKDQWRDVTCRSGDCSNRSSSQNTFSVLSGRVDLDIFSEYIKKNSPIIHGVDGRIKMIQAGQ
uniref:apyrase n=1 Tax=Timema douglasi TaxID=61478 RepID=A0A7R8VPR2_TIMDO|nr:unnamed protein product [Timema douglasi]